MGRASIVAETNFHELPRRRLQQLCKKHGIPANKTNVAMADALTDIYRVKRTTTSMLVRRSEIFWWALPA